VERTFGNVEGSVEGSASVDGVVLGVDTHLDLHVAVAVDWLGRRLGELTFVGRRALAPWGVPG
jgi:hypothetical protein